MTEGMLRELSRVATYASVLALFGSVAASPANAETPTQDESPPDSEQPAEPPTPPPAPAPPVETRAAKLFDEGRALFDEGAFDAACAKLLESASLEPRVGTFGKLATCEERRGRLVVAHTLWLQTRDLARETADDRLAVVEEELARLERSLPKVRVELPAGASSAVRVRLDGAELGSPGLAHPIDPGEHTVQVTAPGKRPFEQRIVAQADGHTQVIEVPSLSDEPVKADSGAGDGSGIGAWSVVGAATVGVGVVGVALGAFYGGLAAGRLEEAENRGCNREPCSPDAAQLLADARSAGDASTALFVVGSALVAGGLTLWILAPDGDDEAASLGATAAIGPQRAGLSLGGTF